MLHVCMLSCLNCFWLFATPWTVPTRLHCPWDSPDKNTGVGCYDLVQVIFPAQDQTRVSCTAGRFFTTEPPGKPRVWLNHWPVQLIQPQAPLPSPEIKGVRSENSNSNHVVGSTDNWPPTLGAFQKSPHSQSKKGVLLLNAQEIPRVWGDWSQKL